jgi:dienelactone hydrolase
VAKLLTAYDEDATLSIDTLIADDRCNGRIGATGMCLGGHLAFRAAFDKRVQAAVCYFATDIHSGSLGKAEAGERAKNDSLQRVGDVAGELLMVLTSHSLAPFCLG